MIYRKFGKTGETVSALGMGGMRFANPDDLDASAEVVMAAFKRGVTYFDTAPFYCKDKSESIFGAALAEIRKTGKRVYTATKTSESKESEMRRELERSIERLGVDAIDFYHVWCITSLSGFERRKKDGVLDTMRKFKEEGLIRHICVSSHLSGEETIRLLDEGIFEGLLIGYCAANFPFRDAAAKACDERGIGMVTMNTLGGGTIPKHQDRFAFIRSQPGESLVQAAIRFNLSQPGVTTALVGFSNVAEVNEAADALEEFKPLAPGRNEEMKSAISQAFNELCTMCGYCLKECPSDLPIARLMSAYNSWKLDSFERMRDEIRWMWDIEDLGALLEACSECRACENACTQHLSILERFEEMKVALKKP